MTPRERFDAALDMHPVDRLPLFYQHLGAAKWILQHTGLTMREGFHDPEVNAKLCMAAHELYGFDNVMAGWGDILVEAQAMGMRWKFPERDFYPRPDVHVPLKEVDKIRPVDPTKDRFWSVPIKSAKIMMDKIGKDVAVLGGLDTPFIVAGNIVGYENLMMALIQNPDIVDQLLGTVYESSKMYIEEMHKVGVNDIFLEDGTAGREQNSLELCQRFDLSYMADEISFLKKKGMRSLVHNCAASPYWKEEGDLRPNGLHIHLKAVDTDEVFRELKGKTCVVAGIDHMELLFKRSPPEIDTEVKGTIEKWGDSPGLMIAPGCELPYKTPVENIKMLKEATIRYGSRS
jgi:MtaA/CmuA family methyltransferase